MSLIRKVRLNTASGQRYVTIPMAQIDIQKDDYVIVKKVKNHEE